MTRLWTGDVESTTTDMTSASSSKAQNSAAIEAAHAKILSMLPQGMVSQRSTDVHRSTWQTILNPTLPPMLAPVPQVCRLLAAMMIAPIIVICLTDFAGYAIFRTLGFRRRRVRVKRTRSVATNEQSARSDNTHADVAAALTADTISSPSHESSPSITVRAPLLTPGAYDADTLLRHRARSISGESVEAEEEWVRTGGRFARVSEVRATQEAAAATAAADNTGSGVASSAATMAANALHNHTSSTRSPPSIISPPDSPRHAFARARGVGVEGALGYSDTDAEDSGVESGRSSPEFGRRTWRRGLAGSSLGFTPVMHQQLQQGSSSSKSNEHANGLHVDLQNTADGSGLGIGLNASGSGDASGSSDVTDRSPRTMDSVSSSWVGVEEAELDVAAARAADLEPDSIAS